jgi:hypothetical protein
MISKDVKQSNSVECHKFSEVTAGITKAKNEGSIFCRNGGNFLQD